MIFSLSLLFLSSLLSSFSIPSSFSPAFSCLSLPLLQSGAWTALRITNVYVKKSYLKQANKHINSPWAVLRLFSKCLLPTSIVAESFCSHWSVASRVDFFKSGQVMMCCLWPDLSRPTQGMNKGQQMLACLQGSPLPPILWQTKWKNCSGKFCK